MIVLTLSRVYQYLLILTVIFLFYGNTLGNGFVYDDPAFITNNDLVHSLSNIPKILAGCLMGFSGATCQEAGVYYHPFLFLQFLFTYQISPDPFLFHAVNLLILSGTIMLVIIFFEKIFGKGLLPILAALLVLINPINSEIGNFVSAVNDQYLVIFFILSFLSLIKFSKTGTKKYLYLSLVFYFLDLVAKESAVFLFIPGLFYYIFLTKPKSKLPLYKLVMLYFIPLLFYLGLRTVVLGKLIHNLTGYHDMSFLTQILTGISIYPLYLSKLIYPLPLNAQHDPPVISGIDLRFYLSLGFWIVNGWLVYLLVRKKLYKILFGFSLIFLSLAPILVLINKIGRFILAERYLFMASIGFSLIILIIYSCISWWVIFQRNKDWHDEFTFNKSIAFLTHENFGVLYNLGVNYTNINQFEFAVDSYKKSLLINPDFWQSHNNLANAYLNLGRIDEAKNEFMIVQKLNPELIAASTSIDNLNLIKSGTKSGILKLNKNLLEYSKDNLSFSFPLYLNLKDQKNKKIISSPDNSFAIEIIQDISGGLELEDYLKTQKENYGVLVNQGLAQIPSFEKAYVKAWNKDGKVSLQFFLFNSSKVIKIFVTPADSPLMKQFDLIIGSMRI
ncbi:tetratricopeptide repeat protein [Candidatus Daviesbacteria bacterium]|nr:tetratricopeptide repeat protein [Candidatus Daviesbacteria bacterium]